jgi:hypothetical protein
MNINFVSYMILLFTLEINILLSSSGSLKASKIDFEKCGNSSKNKIPLLYNVYDLYVLYKESIP